MPGYEVGVTMTIRQPDWRDHDAVHRYFAALQADIDQRVAALSDADRQAWGKYLAENEHFDGEVEIASSALTRFIRHRRGERPTCIKCGQTFDPLTPYTYGATIHFHKESK